MRPKTTSTTVDGRTLYTDGKWRDKQRSVLCSHGVREATCRECGGSGICQHSVRRTRCVVCSPRGAYKAYLNGAHRRGYTFDLSFERFTWLVNQPCVYCGELAGGIDRVNNAVGYTADNAVPCCAACNFVKRRMEAREFIHTEWKRAAAFMKHTPNYATFENSWKSIQAAGPK